MRLKYFLIILLFTVIYMPVTANDVLFAPINTKQMVKDIMPSIKSSLNYDLNLHNGGNKIKFSNPQEVEKIAYDFVDRLYMCFVSTNKELDVKELEYLTKTLKTNIINLATQKERNIELFQTFVEAYHRRSMIYKQMQIPLDLFLSEITSGDGLINTIKVLNITSDEHVLQQIVEINLNSKSWKNFINSNRKDLLVTFMKSDRPMLDQFSQMIENSLDKSISQADRKILTRISIINDMASMAMPNYDNIKERARYGYHNERVTLKAEALTQSFGKLKKTDAQFLSEVLTKTNPSSLEHMLPGAKTWIQGFTKWTRQSLKPKGNAVLSIGAMVAITAVGELIKTYANTSYDYLTAIDEINDSLETENYVNLVYKSVYDNKFAQIFDNILEEDLDENQQTAYAETLILFNRATFDVFFQETEEKINKQIYNCFTYGKDCGKA